MMSGKFCFFISGFILLCCTGVILTAIILTPDPKGYGTHEKTGLPSCMTSRLLGIDRCPSCGLTTAFALIGKGEFNKAQKTHPWAIVLFGFTVLLWFTAVCSLFAKNLKYFAVPLITGFILGTAYLFYWFIELNTIMQHQ